MVQHDFAVPYNLNPAEILTAGGVGSDDPLNSLTIGDTYLFGPNIVIRSRLGESRPCDQAWRSDVWSERRQDNAFTYQPKYLTMPVTGAFSLGSANFSENSFAYTTSFGANDDLNLVRVRTSSGSADLHALDRMVGGPGMVRRFVHYQRPGHGLWYVGLLSW